MRSPKQEEDFWPQYSVELRRPSSSECPRKPTRRKGKEDGGGAGVITRCAKRSARKGGRSGASAGAEDVGVARKSDRCNAALEAALSFWRLASGSLMI
jgi:hypothetical protein